ncbi:MAG: LuxR C-terminal-related transcriptional regulator [Actinomycetota bacterium]|nr:LuxR C-terminal-related transcriptional regulator [Actinomycetota bacterium]
MGEGTATKPQLNRRRIIERPRLTRLLDESEGRIKMLVAPAGYGKTTLARQWLAGKSAAWCTLSQSSNDVAAFAAELVEAVAALAPGSGEALMERLPVTPRPNEEVDVLADMLSQDLGSWPASGWLILDDHQVLAPGSPGDRLIEAVLADAPINALLLTRRRPAWASARRILYGEISEFDRDSLSMTRDEAYELLADTNVADPDELVALAQGWPAVLGLASASGVTLPNAAETPHLYSFFAEEIYRRLPLRTRKILCELTVYDPPGRAWVLRGLERSLAQRIMRASVDSGLIVEATEARVEMHPLVRSFLEGKLRQDFPEAVAAAVERAVRRLMSAEQWDEAHSVMDRFGAYGLLVDLIARALPSLLEAGRVATIRSWLRDAPEEASAVRLALAELAFREGRFFESEALAKLASNEPDGAEDTMARACIAAGRAAHAASRLEEAVSYYRAARSVATNERLRRNSLFGELGVVNELERTAEASELLRILGPPDALPPADHVVLVGRRLNFESHTGVYKSIGDARAAWQLLPFVKDPIARSSFRNVFGYALASLCHLDDARRITAEQLTDAERCRLDFVVPYGLIINALVLYLSHDYVSAEAVVEEALERSVAGSDTTAWFIGSAVQARIFNAQGAFDQTLIRTVRSETNATRWLQAELESCHAVAYAATGDQIRAERTSLSAERLSLSPEARINVAAARAIASHRRGNYSQCVSHAKVALRIVNDSGIVEVFVSAYRGYPELVLTLLSDKESHDAIVRVLALASDGDLSTAARGEASKSVLQLSRREKEVLALVAQGMSNPEIGATLFISPTTVKVHIRHIFEKLGVKSRAEAAVRGVQLTKVQATPTMTETSARG